MVGPFGGLLAAILMQAVLLHPERLGEPVAFTVNFAGPLPEGGFVVHARALRTNRSTQHWFIELLQDEQVIVTATAVFATRRETWTDTEVRFPEVPAAASVPRTPPVERAAWTSCYDMRFLRGAPPTSAQASADSTSHLWLRDEPPRPLDFLALTALCDAFYPRIFLRRPKWTPIGTVSLTTYFHADSVRLQAQGDRFVLGTARALHFGNGYFDQTAEVWADDGSLLATSHQVMYYKE